jgi:hypothetical protein
MSSKPVSIAWKFKRGRGKVAIRSESLDELLFYGTWNYTHDLRNAVYTILEKSLGEITAWMRENAPWTDQTGDARASLRAEMNSLPHEFAQEILLHYADDSVFYAWYLETKNAGKYQIILPTMDRFAAEMLERIRTRTGIR